MVVLPAGLNGSVFIVLNLPLAVGLGFQSMRAGGNSNGYDRMNNEAMCQEAKEKLFPHMLPCAVDYF